MKTLTPVLPFDGAAFVLMTRDMAAIPLARLGGSAGTRAEERDRIVRVRSTHCSVRFERGSPIVVAWPLGI